MPKIKELPKRWIQEELNSQIKKQKKWLSEFDRWKNVPGFIEMIKMREMFIDTAQKQYNIASNAYDDSCE